MSSNAVQKVCSNKNIKVFFNLFKLFSELKIFFNRFQKFETLLVLSALEPTLTSEGLGLMSLLIQDQLAKVNFKSS